MRRAAEMQTGSKGQQKQRTRKHAAWDPFLSGRLYEMAAFCTNRCHTPYSFVLMGFLMKSFIQRLQVIPLDLLNCVPG